MYTFCPNCYTIFRLAPRHLAEASGQACCGECKQAFSAVDLLFEDLPETRDALDLRRQRAEEQAGTAARDKAEAAAAQLLDESQAGDAAQGLEVPTKVPASEWSESPLRMPNVFGVLAIVLLLLAGAMQWVYFNRDQLADNQDFRAGLEEFCKYLRCSLPLQVDLAQLELLNRDVRQHPRVDEALLVNATLSNRAGFTQPYPVLEVSFSDLGGNPIAVRRFRPNEYIIDSYTIKQGMPPGEPVPVVLEILDPGEVAVSYQFGFL